jgi:hypothetical protein
MCQHDFQGRRIFQHRNTDKWDLFLLNRRVKDFWFEDECRHHLARLRGLWDGRTSSTLLKTKAETGCNKKSGTKPPTISAIMLSHATHAEIRDQTLQNLAATDWKDLPLQIKIENGPKDDQGAWLKKITLSALRENFENQSHYLLFLEDDLNFNRNIRHNLYNWKPLTTGTVRMASLYNPNVCELACDVANNARFVAPRSVFGGQAILISRDAVRHLLRRRPMPQKQEPFGLSGFARLLQKPVHYHAPSLVQHIGSPDDKTKKLHQAMDFELLWKA